MTNLERWNQILTIISMVLASVFVLVLVATLVLVAAILGRVRSKAPQLAAGLEAAGANTASLQRQIGSINAGLGAVEGGLGSVDGHLIGVARAYRVV